MRAYAIFFAATLTLAICGCKQKPTFAPKGRFITPGSINPLNGNVIAVVEQNFTHFIYNDSTINTETDSMRFDKDGNLVYLLRKLHDSQDYESVYKYDENGIHSTIRVVSVKDGGVQKIISKKIKEGQFESLHYFDTVLAAKSIYSYDKNSYMTEAIEYSVDNGKEKFWKHSKMKNTNDGRVLAAYFYNVDGKLIGQYDYSYSKHYGPDSVKIDKEGKISKTVCQYDQQGNMTMIIAGDEPPERFSYEYDSKGNWTRRNEYDSTRIKGYQLRKYYYK